jgi:hypothetical protein
VVVCVLLLAPGCGRHEARDSREGPDTAARKAGRASYDAARDAGKLAGKAGHEIREKAHEFQEGWKDAEREHKTSTTQK